MERPFLVAQVSDMHVKTERGGVDTNALLQQCVEHLRARRERPDVVVLTGDLTESGRPAEYARLVELLAPLDMPIYVIPGNHDERAALRAAFPAHAYLRQSPGFIQYAVDEYPLRLLALDTLVPGEGRGEVCAERLAWLDARLGEGRGRPTLVLMHHPPFRTYMSYMDGMGLAGADALAAVIGRHPQVERILCGHLHRPITARFAGTVALTAPSCAHQVALDLMPGAPLRLVMEPPAYLLHAYTPEGGLVTHTAYVGSYANVPLR